MTNTTKLINAMFNENLPTQIRVLFAIRLIKKYNTFNALLKAMKKEQL